MTSNDNLVYTFPGSDETFTYSEAVEEAHTRWPMPGPTPEQVEAKFASWDEQVQS